MPTFSTEIITRKDTPMTTPLPLAPKPKAITINGQPYTLVAFYYPGHDMPWDIVF